MPYHMQSAAGREPKDLPDWDDIACPLCRGRAKNTLFRFAAQVSTVPVPDTVAGLDLVRCSSCSLVYLDRVPSQKTMEQIYASDQYFGDDGASGYVDYDLQQQSLGKTFHLFLKTLHRQAGTCGAVADIGCGNGLLLQQARPWFSLRVGSDMCRSAVDQASRFCDRAVLGGPQQILEAGFSGFDLVTAVSVLEHIYEPAGFLEDCGRLLRPGGHVALTIPPFDGVWRRMMGRFWTSYKIPEHLTFWEKNSLAALGRRAGFRMTHYIPYHHYFPLQVVLDKLGLPVPGPVAPLTGRIHVLLPGVMQTVVYTRIPGAIPGPAGMSKKTDGRSK